MASDARHHRKAGQNPPRVVTPTEEEEEDARHHPSLDANVLVRYFSTFAYLPHIVQYKE